MPEVKLNSDEQLEAINKGIFNDIYFAVLRNGNSYGQTQASADDYDRTYHFLKSKGIVFARNDQNQLATDSTKQINSPVFITEDGQPYYGSETIWIVKLNDFTIGVFESMGKARLTGEDRENTKYFSTEHAANKYVLENKPVLVTFNQLYRDLYAEFDKRDSKSTLVCLITIFDRYTSEKIKK